MVKAVVGDESLDAEIDAIVAEARQGVQVGLVLGRIGSIVALVRTPVKEDGSDAASLVAGSSSRKSSRSAAEALVSLDLDWIAEHARQVSRMLLGGLDVVGIYCLAPESALKQSSSLLCQVAGAAVANSKSSLESLVLHIATSPRRVYCRVCTRESNGTFSLKPCDWKLAKLITNMQTLACSYLVDVSLPISSTSGSIKEVLDSWIELEAENLDAAELVVDGSLIDPNGVLSASDAKHDVELLLPLNSCNSSGTSQASSRLLGTVNLKGAVHARAYAFPREPVSNALLGIKKDILGSLRSRIELVCEESEAPLLATAGGEEFTYVLPRRVLLPLKGSLQCCDYMLPTESLEQVEERCKDMLALEELDLKSVSCPEGFYVPPPGRPREKDDSKEVGKGTFPMMAALLAALVATLLAMLLLLLRKQ